MIRDFRMGDLHDFICMSQAFYESDAVMCRVPEENFRKTFSLILSKSPWIRGYCLTCNDATAGYALLSFSYSNEAGGMVLWIEEIYILPAFREKGIGRAFFNFLNNEYGSSFRRFRLELTQTNLRAASLYERLGFSKLEYVQMIKNNTQIENDI